MEKISILIPTYNQKNYISKCIESALRQDYPHKEIIVSDDCSSDGTWEIIRSYSENPQITAFKNEKNMGRVANYRKLLYECASGDWVLNVDGDDFLVQYDFLSRAMALASKFANTVLITAHRYQYIHETKTYFKQRCGNGRVVNEGKQYILDFFHMQHPFFHLTSVYKRAEALKVGFYQNDIISSDGESLLKLMATGVVVHIDDYVAAWRYHKDNLSVSRDTKELFANLTFIDHAFLYYKEQNVFPFDVLKVWYRKAYIKRGRRVCAGLFRRLRYEKVFGFLLLIVGKDRTFLLPIIFSYEFLIAFFIPFYPKLRNLMRRTKRNDV